MTGLIYVKYYEFVEHDLVWGCELSFIIDSHNWKLTLSIKCESVYLYNLPGKKLKKKMNQYD